MYIVYILVIDGLCYVLQCSFSLVTLIKDQTDYLCLYCISVCFAYCILSIKPLLHLCINILYLFHVFSPYEWLSLSIQANDTSFTCHTHFLYSIIEMLWLVTIKMSWMNKYMISYNSCSTIITSLLYYFVTFNFDFR